MPYDRTKPFNDLPLMPPVAISEGIDILKKLVTASKALVGVNNNVQRLPNPYILVNTIALQKAKASSAIENIFTTEDELYKAVSDTVQERHANPATMEQIKTEDDNDWLTAADDIDKAARVCLKYILTKAAEEAGSGESKAILNIA